MVLRIRREIFKAGEFEQYNETGLLTRDELCVKYHLDRDTTVFYGNGGKLIEGDFIDAPVVVAVQTPAAGISALGVFFITLGAFAVLAGGAYLISTFCEMMNSMGGSHKLSYSNSLRGATNPIRKGGQVGALLGEYSVPADVGGLVYSSYRGDDQYIHQLFSVGYGKSVVFKKDNKFKSDGNPYGYVIRMGESPIDTLNDIKVSPDLAYYNKRCVEESLSMKLTHNEWITRTTPTNTVRIGVGVCAPYGYYALNDKGEETGTEMHYRVEYRRVGTSTWTQPDNGDVVISSANFEKYRNMVSIPVFRGQYEVRVKRMNEDNPDSKYNDTLTVELMQFDTVGINGSASPVNHADRYALMSVEVRATDQLNGYLDQIYIDSFLKCRTYNPATGKWYLPTNPTEVGTMNNPASILLYLLTDPDINPRPLHDSEIDWVSLTEWWKFCNSNGRRWSVNAWITEGITIAELVKNVCMAGRASIHIMDGKYGVLVEDKREDSSGMTIVTQMFTPRNAWDMQETRSFEKQPDVLTLDFLNQNTGEEESRYLIRQSDGTIKVDEELVNADNLDTESLTLWGVTDPRQVAQLGKYHLATLHARNRTYTWNCALESIVCAVGDVVYLANDVFLYSLGYGRIAKVVKNASGAVTDVYVDEAMGIEPGKNYGITVRMNDGTFRSIPVSQDKSESYHLIFESPVDGTVEEGNLFMYGDSDKQGKRVVITEIKPDENNGATITAADYIPELYTIDVNPFQPIPEYQSNISVYGGGQKIGAGGSGHPDFDRPDLDYTPSLVAIRMESDIFHYDSNRNLSPVGQSIRAVAFVSGTQVSDFIWKVGGVVQAETGNSILITPDMVGDSMEVINVEVTAKGFTDVKYITKVFDGKVGPVGPQGPQGWSTATVALYKKSETRPAAYKDISGATSLTYTFATNTLSGTIVGGWSKTIPTSSNPADKLWVIYATAYAEAPTDSIVIQDWTPPEILSQDGTQGLPGINVATLYLYARSVERPTPISSVVSYSFISHQMSGVSAPWSKDIPVITDKAEKLWITTATAASRYDSDTVEPSEWATPVVLTENGANGQQGKPGVDGVSPVYVVPEFNTYVVPASNSGIVHPDDYAKLDCTIEVIQGDTKLSCVSTVPTKGQYKVSIALLDDITNVHVVDNRVVATVDSLMLRDSAVIKYDVAICDFGGAVTQQSGSISVSKVREGSKGEPGENGAPGPQGGTGLTGQYTAFQYYASTSDTTQVGGTWSLDVPSISGGKFLWMRTQIVPAGGSIDDGKWGTPVLSGTDISKLMTTVKEVDDKTTTNAAAIQANADAISTKVTQSYVDRSLELTVDSIQVGGTNLLNNTYDKWYGFVDYPNGKIYPNEFGVLTVTKEKGSQLSTCCYFGTEGKPNSNLRELKAGDTISCSFQVRSSSVSAMIPYEILFFNGDGVFINYDHSTKEDISKWYTVKIENFTLKRDVTYEMIDIIWDSDSTPGVYELRKFKVERGSKATEWSPSPDDTSTAISKNTTAIIQTNNRIDLQAESINQVNDIVQKNSAELSVQAGQIATKVDQSVFDDAQKVVESNTTAITQTQNQIATKVEQSVFDATKAVVESNTTAITQTQNQIALRVDSTTGKITTSAGIEVGMLQKGGEKEGYILLDAPNIIAPGTITADEINAESLGTTKITLNNGGLIQSKNYTKGLSGFSVDYNGNSEFNDVVLRGDVNNPYCTIKRNGSFPIYCDIMASGPKDYYYNVDIFNLFSSLEFGSEWKPKEYQASGTFDGKVVSFISFSTFNVTIGFSSGETFRINASGESRYKFDIVVNGKNYNSSSLHLFYGEYYIEVHTQTQEQVDYIKGLNKIDFVSFARKGRSDVIRAYPSRKNSTDYNVCTEYMELDYQSVSIIRHLDKYSFMTDIPWDGRYLEGAYLKLVDDFCISFVGFVESDGVFSSKILPMVTDYDPSPVYDEAAYVGTYHLPFYSGCFKQLRQPWCRDGIQGGIQVDTLVPRDYQMMTIGLGDRRFRNGYFTYLNIESSIRLGDGSWGDGYTLLPNGLMLQWGTVRPSGSSATWQLIDFQPPFAQTPVVSCTIERPSNKTPNTNDGWNYVRNVNKQSAYITVFGDESGSKTHWLAIGPASI